MNGDAGFRQYYRFKLEGVSYIAVDAPPQYSNNQAFVAVGQGLAENGIEVPEIKAKDLELGFFCLTDFGDTLLATVLSADNMQAYYRQAIDLLPVIANSQPAGEYILPDYDRAFIDLELSIFTEWLLEKHLNIHLSPQALDKLRACFDILIDSALAQPQVTMHRDYHSRNIMLLDNNSLGIIDFQDAVTGPVTYDLVSLLRDCYLRWPQQLISPLFEYYCDLITKSLELPPANAATWQRWFDLMGLQRHLKASGIFARLYHRDNKPGYLKDIPLTLAYIRDISGRYSELADLHLLIAEQVLPALAADKQNFEQEALLTPADDEQ
ncbi:phosphotransferase [Thalassomonas haliotis]|uniref:Phosphotransferase n=2 Tax=Thalassomonas haliotis TaxID=485448 RepID=A0ABY7VKW1_9GAMM|nr:phosphotransferase [Thalassomonas haliotis]